MLEGFDAELDPIGVIPRREVICGDCRHEMVPLSTERFKCPLCGIVFDFDDDQSHSC